MIAFVSALVLTACGADVNTQLKLEDDHSGQRQFVMTMADSDVENLTGGIDGATQAFEAHTPDVLNFEGIESEDEGYSARFTMEFDDVNDYQNKITALLDASDVPEAERGMDVTIDEQQLVTSIVFEEDFYNDDLMGWASDALVEEEVVPDNTTVFTSSGAAAVIYDGEEIETSTSLPRINFSLTDDRRFNDIGMDVEILGSGDFQIAMSYLVSPEDTAIHNQFVSERVQQLNEQDGVEGAVEDSGATENHDSGNTEVRDISATFTSAEAVEEGLQTLLANDTATFEATETVDDSSPDVIAEYRGSGWTCDAICNPSNIQQLDGETEYPDHWQLIDQRRGDGEFYLEFNRGMPLDSLTSTTRLGFDGGLEQTFEFVMSNETLADHEEAVAERFEPASGTASFETARRDGKTVYTTSFQAQDAESLTNQLNEYLEEKGITETVKLQHDPLTGLWSQYNLDVELSAIWELATGGVEDNATFQVELPPLHAGESSSADSSDGIIVIDETTGNFTVTASGPTMTTVWAVIALLVLMTAALVAFLLWRKRTASDRARKEPTGSTDATPYNVQGPHDALTESQILRSPLAPGALGDPTSKTTDVAPIADPERTRMYDQTRPFPDVPIPSATAYREPRDHHEAVDLDDSSENAANDDAGLEDDSPHEDEQR